MYFKKIYLLAMAALAALPTLAQSDDFGIWTSIGADKHLTKQLSVGAEFGFRSANNLENATRWSGTLDLGYKFNSYLKIGAGYAYIYDFNESESKTNLTPKGNVNGYNVDHAYWGSKHRGFFDIVGNIKVGRFKFSLRERYQYTHTVATTCDRTRYRDKVTGGYSGETFPWNGEEFMVMTKGVDEKSGKDKHYLRSRLKVDYNIPHCSLNPFISYEVSNDLADGLDLDKTRLMIGSDWKISKQHSLSFAYLYQNGADGKHEGANHVIDLGYHFKF